VPATLGEFLVLTRQHLDAAAGYRQYLPPGARAEITIELDRLLAVMNRYAAGAAPPGGGLEAIAGGRDAEQLAAGTSLVITRAAGHISDAVRNLGTVPPSHGHPVAGHLRAATDSLYAGRDVLGSHVPAAGEPGAAVSAWLAVIRSRPVGAALMRELGRYCLQLASVTALLTRPLGGRVAGFPLDARQAAGAATEWLAFAGSALAVTGGLEPGAGGGSLLLHAIPADRTPPRQPPVPGEPVPALAAGIIAASDRLTHLARHAAAGQAAASSACCRHDALAAAAISHASHLLLTALASRAAALQAPPATSQGLRHAAGLTGQAQQSWHAAARAWDPVSTGTSKRLTGLSAELTDLVLRTGRLARANPHWTPARRDQSPLRDPADLAPALADFTAVLTAIADATEACIRIARTDEHATAATAARHGIYTPARYLTRNAGQSGTYQYGPALPSQIAAILAAYEHAMTTTQHAVAALDDLLLTTPPVPLTSLARFITRNPAATARPHDPAGALPPPPGTSPGSPALRPGRLELMLRRQHITDPALLLRAAFLDHATQDLTAEATAAARRHADINTEIQDLTGSRARSLRNLSARTASQDHPAPPASRNRAPRTRQPATKPAQRAKAAPGHPGRSPQAS
jgi:hypothetical protein